MSALGQKQTFAVQKGMSALPPKADMCGAKGNVRFVPRADMAPGPHLGMFFDTPISSSTSSSNARFLPAMKRR